MRLPSIVLACALVATLAGCGSTTPESPVDDTPPASESRPANSAGDQLTEGDIGAGQITVAGTTYDGISGDCDLMADGGNSPVWDAMADNVSIVLGVDNISSGQSNKFNFKVLSTDSFTLEGDPSGAGTINTIVILEPRTELAEVDLAKVGINGVTEDGRPVTAEIVCVLAKP